MSFAARPVLRSSALRNVVGRRFESTATTKATETAKETAGKAKEVASQYQAKAAEGLSRVTSAAGPALAGAAKGVSGALGRIGGRTGRLIGFVERQIPSAIYYSRVGLELSKLVFKGQSMSPPSINTFQAHFQNAFKRLQNPSSLAQSANSYTQQARNISPAQLATAGVLVAELLGFFTVGEMIGRMKLVGYHGEVAHHH